MAMLARFLWLWLPMLALFLGGLARALVTGQADPWDWTGAMLLACAGIGLWRGWRGAVGVAVGGAVMILLLCAIAAGRAPDPVAVAGVAGAGALSGVAGAMIVRAARARDWRGGAVALPALGLALLIGWRGPARPVTPVADRPALAVISALPLFWAERGGGGPRDAPIVTLLRTRFTLVPIDDPLALPYSGAGLLLLAQPRALSPERLVAIDGWVRRGGRALVLADPLLRWPSDLPPGDRRRAPTVSLLGPLLDHWGFRPGPIWDAERRHWLKDGGLLTLSGAAGDVAGGGDVVARRRVGRGAVVLLGDADAIDDRLWLADPARPLDPRAWIADTPARIVEWAGGARVAGDRRWMREADDVARALRWALVAGTIWAALGLLPGGRAGRAVVPVIRARAGPGQVREMRGKID